MKIRMTKGFDRDKTLAVYESHEASAEFVDILTKYY